MSNHSSAARCLVIARNTLSAIVSKLDSVLQPPEIERPVDEEKIIAELKLRNREGQRASRRPWYAQRTREKKIPEQLRYYEAVHGTKATVEMLKRQGRKFESEE
jgi:hypothetical protein